MGPVEIEGNLRYLLNEWDPIGVADLVSDEYDCLIAPLWSKLSTGASRAEISEFLWNELEGHFGLNPYHHREHYGIDRLAAWSATINIRSSTAERPPANS